MGYTVSLTTLYRYLRQFPDEVPDRAGNVPVLEDHFDLGPAYLLPVYDQQSIETACILP